MQVQTPPSISTHEKYHEKALFLQARFSEVFQFPISSILAVTRVKTCSISFFEDDLALIVASNDDSLASVWKHDRDWAVQFEQNPEIFNFQTPHSISGYKVKFKKSFPLINEEGNLYGSLNIFHDEEKTLTETEQKILQGAVKQISQWIAHVKRSNRLKMHNNLVELSKDLIGTLNFEGEILQVNPAFTEILGWDSADLLGSSIFRFVHEEDIDECKSAIAQIIEGNPPSHFTNRFYSRTRDIKWMEWTCTLESETGSIYIIGRDVTQYVQKKIQLAVSEQKYRSLFNNLQGILSIHDLDGKFMDVNRAGLQAAGYSRKEMLQGNLYKLIAPEKHDKIGDYLSKLRTHGYASGEMTIVKKSGERAIWYFISTISEDWSGNKQVLTNSVDVTEHRKMAEELKKAKEDAEQAYRIKSEFVANMSHEIRTPLNGIIGFTELVLTTKLDETQKQYLELINQASITLYNIINDILDFSKIENKKLRLSIDKIEIEEVISEAINLVSYGIEKKGLEMLLDIEEDVPAYIWADSMRLKQILVNLLGNALKFTEQGEIKIYVRVVKDSGEGKMTLRFGVKDTGIGIKKEKQREIFKAFSQGDGSITKKYGGTGLGLTISNELLAMANSTLQLESEPGKGSDFYFDLKLQTEEDNLSNGLKNIHKILVVDDNSNNRKILKRMLEIKDIEVEEAENGLKALMLMMENPDFDVVIMDYHMPAMDGIETIRKIKDLESLKHNSPPFIILYSSSDDEKLQKACDELKIEQRLVKPIRMKQMYQVLAGLKNTKKTDFTVTEPVDEPIGSALKILIAEDNEINIFLTQTLIKNILPNAKIVLAKNGEEAVEKFKKESPDLILMDIQMPKLNGYEATGMIRNLEKDIEIPIIALTAGTLPGEKEKCLRAGMNDFLSKPILKQTLSDMLTKWLGVTS